MSLGTVLLIVLILVLLGVIPAWPHSKGWGYAPSGILGLVVVVLLVMSRRGGGAPSPAAWRRRLPVHGRLRRRPWP